MSTVLRLLALFLCCLPGWAAADALPIKVAPAQLLLEGDEGDVLVHEVTLINAGREPLPVKMEAVNWRLDDRGRRVFSATQAQQDDCRDWWAAGMADLLIPPGDAVVYSVEIRIPEEIEDEFECRFAFAFRSLLEQSGSSQVYLPAYLRVEGAEPELEFERLMLAESSDGKTPVVVLRNEGTAHARVYGMMKAVDAQGQKLDIVVRPADILAGETRALPLLISRRGGGDIWWSAPVQAEGRLIWAEGDMDIDGVLR